MSCFEHDYRVVSSVSDDQRGLAILQLKLAKDTSQIGGQKGGKLVPSEGLFSLAQIGSTFLPGTA